MKTLSVFLLSGMFLFLAHTGVAACNLSPIATIETNMPDDIFFHDEAGSFSGTNSYPYCGSINQYRWRVRPLGGTFTTVSSNSVYFHTFTLENNVDEKQYQVELRVRNSAGKYGYATKTITVKRHYTRLYYLTDHLGSVRVTVNDEGDPVGWDDYYPFGLQMPGRTQNQSNPNDDQKFTGYELEQQGDLGLYHAGARMYDPVIGRFNSQDRFKEKYPSMSPYQYAALNPISFIDVNGDSVWVDIDHDSRTLTINYQGSLLNESGKDLNLEDIKDEIVKSFEEVFSGGGAFTESGYYSVDANIDLSIAETIDDVSNSDHLIVISDLSNINFRTPEGNKISASGNVPRDSPKVAHVDVQNFNRFFRGNNIRTVLHEQAHQLGLVDPVEHLRPSPNLMQQGGSGSKLRNEQRIRIIRAVMSGSQNRGINRIGNRAVPPDKPR